MALFSSYSVLAIFDSFARCSVDVSVRDVVDGCVRGAADGCVRNSVGICVRDVIGICVCATFDSCVRDSVDSCVRVCRSISDRPRGAVPGQPSSTSRRLRARCHLGRSRAHVLPPQNSADDCLLLSRSRPQLVMTTRLTSSVSGRST